MIMWQSCNWQVMIMWQLCNCQIWSCDSHVTGRLRSCDSHVTGRLWSCDSHVTGRLWSCDSHVTVRLWSCDCRVIVVLSGYCSCNCQIMVMWQSDTSYHNDAPDKKLLDMLYTSPSILWTSVIIKKPHSKWHHTHIFTHATHRFIAHRTIL